MSRTEFKALALGYQCGNSARVATFAIVDERATLTWDSGDMLPQVNWPSYDVLGIWDEYASTHTWRMVAVVYLDELWLFERQDKNSARLHVRFLTGNRLMSKHKTMSFDKIRVNPRLTGLGFSLEVSVNQRWFRLLTVWGPTSWLLDEGLAAGCEGDFFREVKIIVDREKTSGAFQMILQKS